MLKRIWRALFPAPRVVYPFRSLIDQMKAKDPELYAIVGPMSFAQGRNVWRKVYPDDLADDLVINAKINPIQ